MVFWVVVSDPIPRCLPCWGGGGGLWLGGWAEAVVVGCGWWGWAVGLVRVDV